MLLAESDETTTSDGVSFQDQVLLGTRGKRPPDHSEPVSLKPDQAQISLRKVSDAHGSAVRVTVWHLVRRKLHFGYLWPSSALYRGPSPIVR